MVRGLSETIMRIRRSEQLEKERIKKSKESNKMNDIEKQKDKIGTIEMRIKNVKYDLKKNNSEVIKNKLKFFENQLINEKNKLEELENDNNK